MQSFLYFYPMPLIARTFILFVFLAVCAGASDVQVIEGDADGELGGIILGDQDERFLYGEPVERGSVLLGECFGVDGVHVGKA